MNGFMLQKKATSYLNAVLDQEGPVCSVRAITMIRCVIGVASCASWLSYHGHTFASDAVSMCYCSTHVTVSLHLLTLGCDKHRAASG
jgi:hypothetical protein